MLPTRLTAIDYCAGQNCPTSPPPTLQEKRQQGFLEPLEFEWEGGGYRWESAPDYAPPQPIDRTAENDQHTPTARGSQFVDLDGDGRPDFVHAHGGTDIADGLTYSQAWRNTGHSFEPASYWALPVPLIRDDGVLTGATFADMDGDGLPDLVTKQFVQCPDPDEHHLPCSAKVVVWLNRMGNSETAWQLAPGFSTIPDGWNGGWIDFIGPDKIADMNGDGKADLVRFGPDNDVQVRYSTGSGWETPDPLAYDYSVSPLTFLGAPQINQMRLEDVNRDGLPDIVAGSQNSLCHSGAYGINQGIESLSEGCPARRHAGVLFRVEGPSAARVRS